MWPNEILQYVCGSHTSPFSFAAHSLRRFHSVPQKSHHWCPCLESILLSQMLYHLLLLHNSSPVPAAKWIFFCLMKNVVRVDLLYTHYICNCQNRLCVLQEGSISKLIILPAIDSRPKIWGKKDNRLYRSSMQLVLTLLTTSGTKLKICFILRLYIPIYECCNNIRVLLL